MEHREKIATALALVLGMLLLGTLLFHLLEGWNWVDSFYFTGMTLTTIGYGDFVPTHDVSKIFVVFFALGGVGLVLFALSVVAEWYFHRSVEPVVRRVEKMERTAFGLKGRIRAKGKKTIYGPSAKKAP